MKRFAWQSIVVLAAMLGASIETKVEAFGPRWYAQHYQWHHDYYDVQWGGAPHALVVPPNTRRHVEYNWDVAGTESLPIRHQFQRGYFGGVPGGGAFSPAPVQPSSTKQMGTYYIRAPR